VPLRHEHVDELIQANGRWELWFTRTLDHPAAEVWPALTEPARRSAWFPFDVEGECAPGARLRFTPRDGSDEAFDGEVVACDRPTLFSFRWRDGEAVRFELDPRGARTVLTLVVTLAAVGDAAREAAGWHVALDGLIASLAGREPEPATPERVLELFRGYAQAYGDEAAAQAAPEPSRRS
jgi:uncharacterized protein YndB with AHSA1/START domain